MLKNYVGYFKGVLNEKETVDSVYYFKFCPAQT